MPIFGRQPRCLSANRLSPAKRLPPGAGGGKSAELAPVRGAGRGGDQTMGRTSANGSSASASSAGVCGRSAGSFAINRRTRAATPGGTTGRNCSTGSGSTDACRSNFSNGEPPGNGTSPVSKK